MGYQKQMVQTPSSCFHPDDCSDFFATKNKLRPKTAALVKRISSPSPKFTKFSPPKKYTYVSPKKLFTKSPTKYLPEKYKIPQKIEKVKKD